MKRRTCLNLFCVPIVVALLASALFALFSWTFNRQTFRESVQTETRALAALLGETWEPDRVEALLDRLSKTSEGNTVYGLSAVREEEEPSGDNILQQAVQNGQGELSQGGNYIYALLLKDGYVLRVERPYPGSLPYFLAGLSLFVVISGMGCAFALFLTRRFSKREDNGQLFRPTPAKEKTDGAEQLAELLEERASINQIMDTMQEGLVLISRTKKILIVNQSALRYLKAEEEDYLYQSVVSITRNPKLLEGLSEALDGKNVTGILESGESAIRYFANPALNDGVVTGVILFLVDVTVQRQEELQREAFSANVSHEIRTPLKEIASLADNIRREAEKAPLEASRTAEKIKEEAKWLTGLVDDMMRLSQINSGNGEKSKTKVNLYSLVQGVCMSLEEQAKRKDVEIHVAGSNLTVEGDLGMLHGMIQNICENALRYTPARGRIDISVEEVGGKAIFTVADTGIGISADNLPHVFERFFRVDKARFKQSGSAGLGLSIAKSIAEYHGGTIAIESEEGKGTTVTVTL